MAKNNNLTEFLTNTANAIREAEGGTSDTINAQNFEARIKAIPITATSDANAAAGDILENKFAYVGGVKVEGEMTDNGNVTPAKLNAGGSYTIPAGYHGGSGKVTAKTLASQTPGSATASDIALNKTAWVNGTQVIGKLETWNGSGTTIDGVDTDGLRGTWVFDEDITTNSDLLSWTFNFSSNGTNFTSMEVGYNYNYENYVLLYYSSDSDPHEAYMGEDDMGYWISSNFRTIEITSALSEVEDGSSLLYYLQGNATKQSSAPSTAGVYYGSSHKASLTNNTVITLPVKGLKMDSDITIIIK